MADITREQIVFELQAEVAAAQAKVERFKKAVDSARASGQKVGGNLKRGLAGAELQLKKTTQSMNQYTAASRKAAGGSTFLFTQIGYLASDARYGLLGMANNMSIVAIGLQQMATKAKQTGQTFGQAFRKGLFGPGGIIVGIQILIALLPEIIKYFSKLSGESEKFTGKIDVSGVKLKVLARRLNDVNLSLKERKQIMDDLDRSGVKVKGPDGKFLENSELIQEAIKTQIDLIILRSKAQLITDEIVKKEREKTEGDWFDRNLGFAVNMANAIQVALGMEDKGGVEGHIKRASKGVAKELDDLYLKLEEVTKKMYALGPKSNKDTLFNRIFGDLKAQNAEIDEQLRRAGESEIETLKRNNQEYLDSLREKFSQGDITQKQYYILLEEAEAIHQFNMDVLRNENNLKVIEKLNQFNLTERELLQIQRDKEIEDLKEFLYKKGATEEETAAAINAKKKQYRKADIDNYVGYAHETIKVGADLLQKAAQADPKNKKLAKASINANAAVATIGTYKQWIADPGGPLGPIGNIIAAVAQTAGIWIAAQSAKRQVDSGGSGGGGGGASRPSFNIVGQNGNNALQATIQEQTGILQEGKNDQRVVLVTSDLEVKQNDNKVAVETATL